jgi:hypothetical protein
MEKWRVWAVLLSLLVGAAAAEEAGGRPVIETILAPSGREATADWSKGEFRAVGMAPRQPDAPPALEVAWMRRVAMADAYRTLVESLSGVRVTAETTVEKMMLVSDTIKTRVEGVLRGFRIVQEGMDAKGALYLVTVAVGLTSDANVPSLAAVTVPSVAAVEQAIVAARAGKEPVPAPPPISVPVLAPTPPTPLPERKAGPYSGLVVDTRGFGLKPCMAPKIMRRDRSEVWGTVQVSAAFVNSTGIVGFVKDLKDALNPTLRAGDNPLVVRAVGRHGSVWADAVVSDEDAALILEENGKSKFLDRFKVIFVID